MMPDISAAVLVVAGALLVLSGSVSASLKDAARQRLVGMGYGLAVIGFIAWLLALVAYSGRWPI